MRRAVCGVTSGPSCYSNVPAPIHYTKFGEQEFDIAELSCNAGRLLCKETDILIVMVSTSVQRFASNLQFWKSSSV